MTFRLGRVSRLVVFCGLIWCQGPQNALAGDALVAVAANFADAMEGLEKVFEQQTGHGLRITTGSTGKLYAQIVNGAPFDVLLAADQVRPIRLERESRIVPGSRFTYAVGKLVLWSPDAERIGEHGRQVLQRGDFRKLAIANPDLAPYGAAARETLIALGLYGQLRTRIVMGENIGQAYALMATGNAELGLVALSQVVSPRNTRSRDYWEVPGGMYTSIKQDAVLLERAKDNVAARAFVDFLAGDQARDIIVTFGYERE